MKLGALKARLRHGLGCCGVGIALLANSLGFAFPVTVGYAPQSSLRLLLQAVESARRTLIINIYELNSPEIAAAIIAKINEGVRVELLLEGQPVAGMKPAGIAIEAEIVKAMKKARNGSRFYEMNGKINPGSRRYRFDHAKYMIIDDSMILVGSENYSTTGHPSSPQQIGNRGWEVLIENGNLLRTFRAAFNADTKTQYGDVFELVEGPRGSSFRQEAPLPKWLVENQNSLPALMRYLDVAVKNPVLQASRAVPVFSPETSEAGLLRLIQSAKKTLEIEQMSFPYEWKDLGANSPIFEAVVAAARRGVRTRILLNDESVFNFDDEEKVYKNVLTAKLMRALAKKEGLNLDARIANIKKMGVTYIHNKGVLVDGLYTLISSINWTENSVKRNRETAVVLEGPEIHAYYAKIFEWDWKQSATALSDDPVNRPIKPDAEVCPLGLRVRGQIREIKNPARPVINGYPALIGVRLDETFYRVSRRSPQGGCVYLRESDLMRVGSGVVEQFLEVRTQKSASPIRQFFFNSRVGAGGALSLRVELPSLLPTGNFEGKYKSVVFDVVGEEELVGAGSLQIDEVDLVD